MTDQELIQAARAMLTRSYAPFSHYAVGAALLGTPCGICRQLLYEFSDGLVMLCCKGDGSYLALTAEELLPHGVKSENMA